MLKNRMKLVKGGAMKTHSDEVARARLKKTMICTRGKNGLPGQNLEPID